MAGGLPPPPTRAESGDFVWVAWYNELQKILSTTGGVTWDLVNKAGSSIADLQSKSHALLTSILGTGSNHISSAENTLVTNLNTTGHAALSSILGTGSYHISAAEATNVTALPTASSIALNTFGSKNGAPTSTEIPSGQWALYKDTATSKIFLWANDGGTFKKVELV